MKALFIGGTGTISTSISELLIKEGWELTLLNRGSKPMAGAEQIICDVNDEAAAARALEGRSFDVVADFIAFVPAQVERDIRLFKGRTKQYFFISSASAYQKPLSSPVITESTPLANPYWEYSRNKITCEEILMKEYRENGFPVTIIRPSHTYAPWGLPLCVHGRKGPWQVLDRMLKGKKVLVPADGATLWTVTASRDFAPGFVGLMGNVHAIGEAVQITSDERLTWDQIHRVVADELGVEYRPCYVPAHLLAKVPGYDFNGELIGDKTNCVIFDNTKLKRLVPGFVCRNRFDIAGRESVRYIMAHEELHVPDPEFDALSDKIVAAMEKAEQEICG